MQKQLTTPADRHQLLTALQVAPWNLTEAQAVDFIAYLVGINPMRPITIMDFHAGDIAMAREAFPTLNPETELAMWHRNRANAAATDAYWSARARKVQTRTITATNPVTGPVKLRLIGGGL